MAFIMHDIMVYICAVYRPGAATLSITLLDPRLPVPAGRHPPTRQLSMLPHGGVHKATVYAARAYALWQSLFANTSSTRHENGAQLEKTQLEKLDREMGLRQELAELPSAEGEAPVPKAAEPPVDKKKRRKVVDGEERPKKAKAFRPSDFQPAFMPPHKVGKF